MKSKTSPLIGFLLFIWFLLPIPLGLYISMLKAEIQDKSTVIRVLQNVVDKFIEADAKEIKKEEKPTPKPTELPKKTEKRVDSATTSPKVGTWVGKVSHYSRAGCLGCSATLTMANGQPLNDEALTIAFNWLPMNTKVRLTNLDNGKTCEATVTDTGGFNKLGRIADLVPAVARALETKTDVSQVKIETIN